MADLIGKFLGKYEVLKKIGKGGMAEVYKAYHKKLDRYVTIKILHAHLIEGEGFLARFEREARAVANLRHPSIVQIHDYDHQDENYYMVMELVDGGTLKDKIREYSRRGQYMPVDEVMTIFRQISSALDYAHSLGIIHRDIKPSNVLLDKKGNAFLTDFGIARIMSDVQVTATGALIGTPTYMSPEQGMGEELSNASDVYSLGVVFFELLTGKVPFASDTPLATIHKHITHPLPNSVVLRPEIPVEVQQVLEKAMEKEPEKRYQSCSDFEAALEDVITDGVKASLQSNIPGGQEDLAAMPTMVDEESITPSMSELPTEVMEDDEEFMGSLVEEETAAPEKKEQVLKKKVKRAVDTALSEPDLVSQKRDKNRLVFYIGAAAVLIVIAILVISSLNGSNSTGDEGSCSTVEECITLRDEYLSQDDIHAALESLERAIEFVPFEEHQHFAWLWWDKADLMDAIGEHSEADISREAAEAWERGE